MHVGVLCVLCRWNESGDNHLIMTSLMIIRNNGRLFFSMGHGSLGIKRSLLHCRASLHDGDNRTCGITYKVKYNMW